MGKLKEELDKAERDMIRGSLAMNNGNVKKTAEAIGIERTNLHKRMKAHGITAAPYRPQKRFAADESIPFELTPAANAVLAAERTDVLVVDDPHTSTSPEQATKVQAFLNNSPVPAVDVLTVLHERGLEEGAKASKEIMDAEDEEIRAGRSHQELLAELDEVNQMTDEQLDELAAGRSNQG